MLKANLMRALVFLAIVGAGALQAGEVPPMEDCSDFNHSGCAQNPADPGDTCNGWLGAESCRDLTGAPSSCDVTTTACTHTGCGSLQSITCEFSGWYDPEEVECEGEEGCGGGPD